MKPKQKLLLTLVPVLLNIVAHAQISPTPPPEQSSLITNLLGYLSWIGLAAVLGVGGIIAAIRIGLEHNMEEGKKTILYSVIGGVIVFLVLYLLSSVGV